FVMPGLVPGIHAFRAVAKTWMAGTSPAMTATLAQNALSHRKPVQREVEPRWGRLFVAIRPSGDYFLRTKPPEFLDDSSLRSKGELRLARMSKSPRRQRAHHQPLAGRRIRAHAKP